MIYKARTFTISFPLVGDEKERLTESAFLKLLSKPEGQQMPMSTVDKKLKRQKKSEDTGKEEAAVYEFD